jgi:hypothetical protein
MTGSRAVAVVALAALVMPAAGCDDEPVAVGPSRSPGNVGGGQAAPSADPAPTIRPLPLARQDPCRLLPAERKALLRSAFSSFDETPESYGDVRACKFVAVEGNRTVVVSIGLEEHGGVVRSAADLSVGLGRSDVVALGPLESIGRHQGAYTADETKGYSATYSILVTATSRVEVTAVVTTYSDDARETAKRYATWIEPYLP